MSIKKGVIEVSPLAGQFFPSVAQDDLVIRTTHETQQVLIGILSNTDPAILLQGGRVGIHNASPLYPLDIKGVLHTNSNLLVDGRIAINSSNPVVSMEIHGSDAILLPKGTTAQRPTVPTQGHVRYNTDTSQFEGFGSGNAWGSLGGVKDTNQDTYVSAETYPTSNDDQLRFVNSNVETMRITKDGSVGVGTMAPTERVDIRGNLKVTSNAYIMSNLGIGVSNPSERLVVDGNITATGTIRASNLMVLGDYVVLNTITSNTEQMTVTNDGTGPGLVVRQLGPEPVAAFYDDSNIALMIADEGKVAIGSMTPSVTFEVHGKDAILLPKGTTAERPSVPVQGHVRYNTSTNQFEGYGAGDAWGSLGGVKDTNQDTYISAESYPTSNDDVLRFYNSNQETMRITKDGFVGIGTSNVSERLKVQGDAKITGQLTIENGLQVQGDILPVSNITYDLGSSNFRFKDLYLSGNTIDLGGTKIRRGVGRKGIMIMEADETLTETEMQQLTLSNYGEVRIYTSNNNLGVNKSNPQYDIDLDGHVNIGSNLYIVNQVGIGTHEPGAYKLNVDGAIYTTGYCNLLVDSITSNTPHRAATASAVKALYDIVQGLSNSSADDLANFQNQVITDLYPIAIYGSNTSFYASNLAIWTSNNALTKKGDIFTNLALGTSNNNLGTLVISTSNEGRTAIYAENVHASNDLILDMTNFTSNTDTLWKINAPHNGAMVGIESSTKTGNFIIDTSNDILITTSAQQRMLISSVGVEIMDSLAVADNVSADSFLIQRASDASAQYASLGSDSNDNIVLQNQTSDAGIYMKTSTADGVRNIMYMGGNGSNNGDPGQVTLETNVNLLVRQGRVGINTLSPGTEFDMVGNANITGIVESGRMYSSGFRVRKNTAPTVGTRCNILSTDIIYSPYPYIKFHTSYSNEVARFINGYLGINTQTPSEMLHVQGGAYIASNLQVNGKVLYRNVYSNLQELPPASNVYGMVAHVVSTGSLYYARSNTSNWEQIASFSDLSWISGTNSNIYRMGGRIGIGTSNPAEALSVQGNITSCNIYANHVYMKNSFATTNDFPSASNYAGMFVHANDTKRAYISDGSNWVQLASTTDVPFTISNMIVYTTQSNYKLGFGTALPQEILHVEGNIKSSNVYADKVYMKNTFCNLSDLPEASNYQGMFSHVWALNRAYMSSGTSWTPLANQTDISFTQTSSNVFFNRTGNVGIGVSNASRKLHVGGDIQSSNMYPEKVFFKNIFPSVTDLPDASNANGMFAVVTSTKRSYFCMSDQWIPLASSNDVGWVAGSEQLHYNGKIGINANNLTEAFTVDGNMKITSNIYANAVFFKNAFSNETDLPFAGSNQGMFAYVTSNERGYVSTGSNWIMLANSNDVIVTWNMANSNVTFDGTGEISGTFKYDNAFSNIFDLPNAQNYRGMFVTLLSNELPYYSTPTNGWVALARREDVPFEPISSNVFFTVCNVGIGTSNPLYSLDARGPVVGVNTWSTINDLPDATIYSGTIALVTNDGNPYIAAADGTWKRMAYHSNIPWVRDGSNITYSSGSVGIGTSNLDSNVQLRVLGQILQNSQWNTSNDLPSSDGKYGSIAYLLSNNTSVMATSNGWETLAFARDNPWSSNLSGIRYTGNAVGINIGAATPVATLQVGGRILGSNAWSSCNVFPSPEYFIGSIVYDRSNSVPFISKETSWERVPLMTDLSWTSNNSNIKYNGGYVGIGVQGDEPEASLDVRGKVVFNNQWALYADLPAASNHVGTVAWVVGDQKMYIANSNSWTRLPLLDAQGGLAVSGALLHNTVFANSNSLPEGASNYKGTIAYVNDENALYASMSNKWEKLPTSYDIGWSRISSTNSNLTFDASVGIGTNDPSAKLEVMGTFLAQNGYTTCNDFPSPMAYAGTTVYASSNNKLYISRSNDWMPVLTQSDIGWTLLGSNYHVTGASIGIGVSNTSNALLEVSGPTIYQNLWGSSNLLPAASISTGVIAFTSNDGRLLVSRSNAWTTLVTVCNVTIASNLPPVASPGELAYVETDDVLYVSLASNTWRTVTTSGDRSTWYSSNGNLLYTAGGRLGVNVLDPIADIDVEGDYLRMSTSNANSVIRLNNNSDYSTMTGGGVIEFTNSNFVKGKIAYNLQDNSMSFYTTSNNSMLEAARIQTNGAFGIGTSDPKALLHVNGRSILGDTSLTSNITSVAQVTIPFAGFASSNNVLLELQGVQEDNIANNDGGGFIKFRTSASSNWGPEIGGIRKTDGRGDLIFRTGYSNLSTRMVVSDSGQVGIGTTAPNSALHVMGDAEVSGKLITEQVMIFALSDELSTLATGTSVLTIRAPFAMTLTKIPRATLSTASTGGAIVETDVLIAGTSIFGSSKLTIDSGSETSTGAITTPTLTTTSVANDAKITFDILQAGSGAKGLKIMLYYKMA